MQPIAGNSILTIVVSFRERWSLTASVLAALVRDSAGRYPVWLLDPGMPAHVAEQLEPLFASGAVERIEIGAGALPTRGRAIAARRLTTPYAVFVDNDLIGLPGWIDALVGCAEATGAGIVGPLYLWGSDGGSDLIHMAGGDLALSEEGGGRRMADTHRHSMRQAGDPSLSLRREPCDFAEYHCLLMRRDVYRDEQVFDPAIATVHEHIHASLVARELGFATWFEPAARVNYLAFSPWRVSDLPAFRARWSPPLAEASLQRFARRWDVIDDDRFRNPVRWFLGNHSAKVDPLDVRPLAALTRDRTMTRGDLQQSFAGLVLQARERGFDDTDIRLLANAYQFAMVNLGGLFRPCGRPFLNHLVGTASVLLFYGCTQAMVMAGMLHSAISHGRTARSDETDREIVGAIARMERPGQRAAQLVRLFDARAALYREIGEKHIPPHSLQTDLAHLYLIEAANDIDMHLSLEVALSGRGDVLRGDGLAYCRAVLDEIGLPAMAAALTEIRDNAPDVPPVRLQDEAPGSFLIEDGRIASGVRAARPQRRPKGPVLPGLVSR